MLMFHFKIEWEFTVWVMWETDLLTQPGYLSSSKHLLIVMPSFKAIMANHPVHMWSMCLMLKSSSPSPSSGSDSENTSYAWFEWDAIIDLDWKYANTSNLQTCKLSCCLSASQSSNRAAKWLHVDSSTERKWERYSIALCFSLFSFSLSFLNRSFSAIFVGGKPIYNNLVAKIITSAAQSS